MGINYDIFIATGITLGDVCDYCYEWDETVYKLPWMHEGQERVLDYEDWWRSVNGYVPLRDDFYTETGDYNLGAFNGSREELMERMRDEWSNRRDWDKENPRPFEVLCCGHIDDELSYLLVIPDSIVSTFWGPKEVSPAMGDRVTPGSFRAFKEFVHEHLPHYREAPVKTYLGGIAG